MLVCSGLFCAAIRLSNSGIDASIDIIAAQTAMPTGNAQYSEETQHPDTVTANTEPSVIPPEPSKERCSANNGPFPKKAYLQNPKSHKQTNFRHHLHQMMR